MNTRLTILLTLVVFLLSLKTIRAERQGGVIYVDDSAMGANNGTSWTDAYTSLQSALAQAGAGDEIWIAAGTYTPGSSRADTFRLKDAVAVYGGFAGHETSRQQRDWDRNLTLLSGEIGGSTSQDNSYHVVEGSATGASTILDGVTVSGGYADGGLATNFGGGMYNESGSPTIANAKFLNNVSVQVGGAMYNEGSSPTLVNVIFQGNTAPYGGAVWNGGSSPTFVNAIFSGNRARAGGAIYGEGGGGGRVVNSVFYANSAGVGSAISGGATVYNSIFWDNVGEALAGGASVQFSLVQGGYAGTGNISTDPGFVDADGADDLPGTADDDLRLLPTSPAVDAGINSYVPSDRADLDNDRNRSEPVPLDLAGALRFRDVIERPDTGAGTPPIVDVGPYEIQQWQMYLPLVRR